MKKIPDIRYTIAREYCGYATARHVARFCGDWIGHSETRAGAVDLARAHRAKFLLMYCRRLSRRNGRGQRNNF